MSDADTTIVTGTNRFEAACTACRWTGPSDRETEDEADADALMHRHEGCCPESPNGHWWQADAGIVPEGGGGGYEIHSHCVACQKLRVITNRPGGDFTIRFPERQGE